jgi:hypothetical protein
VTAPVHKTVLKIAGYGMQVRHVLEKLHNGLLWSLGIMSTYELQMGIVSANCRLFKLSLLNKNVSILLRAAGL